MYHPDLKGVTDGGSDINDTRPSSKPAPLRDLLTHLAAKLPAPAAAVSPGSPAALAVSVPERGDGEGGGGGEGEEEGELGEGEEEGGFEVEAEAAAVLEAAIVAGSQGDLFAVPEAQARRQLAGLLGEAEVLQSEWEGRWGGVRALLPPAWVRRCTLGIQAWWGTAAAGLERAQLSNTQQQQQPQLQPADAAGLSSPPPATACSRGRDEAGAGRPC